MAPNVGILVLTFQGFPQRQNTRIGKVAFTHSCKMITVNKDVVGHAYFPNHIKKEKDKQKLYHKNVLTINYFIKYIQYQNNLIIY